MTDSRRAGLRAEPAEPALGGLREPDRVPLLYAYIYI